eukprot:4370254-Pleurochrysis_carterae.AAC.1
MAMTAAALDSVATPNRHPPGRHTFSREGGCPVRRVSVAELCAVEGRAPRARGRGGVVEAATARPPVRGSVTFRQTVTHGHVGDGKERQERLPQAPCAPFPALSERGSHSRRS